MFKLFQGLESDIATRTDLRLLLAEPNDPESKFVNELSFSAEGVMRVKIGEMFFAPALAFEDSEEASFSFAGDIFVLPWMVTSMEATADSVFGEIKVTNYEGRPSFGIVKPKTGNNPFPAELKAEVCASITIPNFGELHTITPIPIKADINSIPPFGVEAKHVNSGILVNEEMKPRGMIIGRSITLVGPA